MYLLTDMYQILPQQEAIYVDPYNRVRIMEMLSHINIILNCELTLNSSIALKK